MRRSLALSFILIPVLQNSIGFGIVLTVMPRLIKDVTGAAFAAFTRIVTVTVNS